jgi:predicted enzyme related to lactoylglutathione lyase
MIEALATVWLPVNDMQQAVSFYGDTLGLEVEQRDEEWSMLKAGEVRIGLNGRESPSGDGGAVVAFRAHKDIEGAVEDLVQKGVEVPGGVTEHPWGRVATFKDPDGNDLQFYEPPGD